MTTNELIQRLLHMAYYKPLNKDEYQVLVQAAGALESIELNKVNYQPVGPTPEQYFVKNTGWMNKPMETDWDVQTVTTTKTDADDFLAYMRATKQAMIGDSIHPFQHGPEPKKNYKECF